MVFVIAEVGCNFNDFSQAKDSIQAAAMAGADAVKFQLFSEYELYGYGSTDRKLKPEWLPQLVEKAEAAGIEFMCSAFSVEGYDIIDPYVKRHKIAHSEGCWPQLLDHVASKRKPTLITVGAFKLPDLKEITKPGRWKSGVAYLYGEPVYPSRGHNLWSMTRLADELRALTGQTPTMGFSDHSTDIFQAPLLAVKLGAQYIEKHVQFFDGVYPDTANSLTGAEFKRMVDAVKADGLFFTPGINRHDWALKYVRRLMATRDINQGETLRYGVNFAAYRSKEGEGRGAACRDWEILQGRDAAHSIPAWTGICLKDVQ